MATQDEVFWLYKCLLHREPEDDGVHLHYSGFTFENLRRHLAVSDDAQVARAVDAITAPVAYKNIVGVYRQPSLAIAAIVKNGAKTIVRMLRSCQPIASRYVIYDTGSTDDTLEIAHDFLDSAKIPFTVRSGEFIDFAHSRNRALELVPSSIDWVLMLDADEYIVREDFHLLINIIEQSGLCDGWALPRYNFADTSMSNVLYYPDYQRRLIRNLPHIRYIRPVHEALRGVSRWGVAPPNLSAQGGLPGGPHIHHTGHVDTSDDEKHAKNKLYADLAARE